MKHVTVKLNNNGPQTVPVLKNNPMTYVVKLNDNNIVKRHKVKHVIPDSK